MSGWAKDRRLGDLKREKRKGGGRGTVWVARGFGEVVFVGSV